MQAASLGSHQRKVMEKRKGDSHALWVSVQDSNGGLQGTMEAKESRTVQSVGQACLDLGVVVKD